MALVDLKRRKFVFGLKVFIIEMAQNKFQLHYNCDNCQRWWIRKWFPKPEMTRERANARVHCSLFFRFIQHCHFTEWLNYMVKTFVTIKNHFFFCSFFFSLFGMLCWLLRFNHDILSHSIVFLIFSIIFFLLCAFLFIRYQIIMVFRFIWLRSVQTMWCLRFYFFRLSCCEMKTFRSSKRNLSQ